MPVGTSSLAISAAALSVAEQVQHDAAVAACRQNMPGFTNDGATVTQMRDYAHCVGLVHPDPIDGLTILFLKGLFVLFLVGLVVGAVKGHRDRYSDWTDCLRTGVAYGIFTPLLAAGALLIGAGIVWLFS